MNDLKQVFERDLRRIPDPPDWGTIERHAAEPHLASARPAPRLSGPRPPRRVAAIVVAATVTAALVGGLIAVSIDGERPAPGSSPTTTAPLVDPQSAVVVGLDGQVTERFGPFPRDAFALTLAPDGRTVAYVRTETPGTDRLIVRRGSRTRAILPFGISGSFPAWSPDGSRIAFQGHGNQQGEDIYVVDANGGHLRRLTSDPANDTWPAWSPNGNTIVYVNQGRQAGDASGNTPTSTLWTVPAAGGTPTRIPGAPKGVSNPDYSPNGRQIAFGWDGIGVIDVGGENLRRLSSQGGMPRWSPDASTIAFLDYDDTWRASIDIFGSIQDVPVLDVRMLNVATGAISSIGTTQVATVSNAPRWLPSDNALFIYRVQRRSGES
jgi:Tol biopolymer transport system component